ncbi:MAG TPA: SpoIIE family protein phosphatase [Kiritimatiellia bacterium]|nr:SpoIIE family protein phosphatase [Kiritimatiellia bacterium]
MSEPVVQATSLLTYLMAATQLLLAAGGAYMYFRWQKLRRLHDQLLQEKEVIFGFVHDVGEVFAEADMIEPDLLLKRVLFYALRTTRASAGAIYLLDRNTDELFARALSGIFPPLDHALTPSTATPVSKSRHVEQLVRSVSFARGEGMVGQVADLNTPLLIANGDVDPRVPKHEIDFLRIQSMLLVPMRFHQDVLGVLTVANRIDGQPFAQTDLNLLQALADQASAAIHYAGLRETIDEKKRIDHDLALARQIQSSLLPKELPRWRGVEIGAFNQPAQQIGGDYFDFVEIDEDHLGIAIADVSGKSIGGALLMSICRSVLRAQSAGNVHPAEVLKSLNRVMSRDISDDMFVTMLYMVYDRGAGRLKVARAGHEKPVLVDSSGQIRLVESRGTAIGMTDADTFDELLEEVEVPLGPGELLVCYTDGITEAMDGQGEEWGTERFFDACRDGSGPGARALVETIRHRLDRFVGDQPPYDDMTLLAIRRETP